jgi:hypothetical protein
MTPHDVLTVQLIDAQQQPIRMRDVAVRIDFFLNGTHRYGFRLGSTGEDGHLQVTYGDVEQRRLESLKMQPWDYKTRLEECDPMVRLSVPTSNELNAAVQMATSFNMGVVPADAEQWARANNHCVSCGAVEVEMRGGEVAVFIPCEAKT